MICLPLTFNANIGNFETSLTQFLIPGSFIISLYSLYKLLHRADNNCDLYHFQKTVFNPSWTITVKPIQRNISIFKRFIVHNFQVLLLKLFPKIMVIGLFNIPHHIFVTLLALDIVGSVYNKIIKSYLTPHFLNGYIKLRKYYKVTRLILLIWLNSTFNIKFSEKILFINNVQLFNRDDMIERTIFTCINIPGVEL